MRRNKRFMKISGETLRTALYVFFFALAIGNFLTFLFRLFNNDDKGWDNLFVGAFSLIMALAIYLPTKLRN